MSTQWRWTGGMESRRCGFDLAVLPVVYEGLEVGQGKRAEVFQGLQVMENAALSEINS
jgi:hypothetical protein